MTGIADSNESGEAARPHAVRELRAGPLTASLAGGDLRYVRIGPVELVRRIFVSVRDDVWGTVPGRLRDLHIAEDATSFLVRFESLHESDEIHFSWLATIEALATLDGDLPEIRLRYEMVGRAGKPFLTNRTGLCVLHPIQNCAGLSCEVEHADGSRTADHFPELIAPYRLFTNMTGLTYKPAHGLRVELRFHGEIFECEDQRNWTDGSFKTYCRPLDWPMPYRLEKSAEVRHRVEVRISRSRLRDLDADSSKITRLGPAIGKLPMIGLRMNRDGAYSSEKQIETMRSLGLSQLRVDLSLQDQDAPLLSRADSAARLAVGLRLPIELAIHVAKESPLDPRLGAVFDVFAGHGAMITRILLYVDRQPVTSASLVQEFRRWLGHRMAGTFIGGGTDGNFAELNRAWPESGPMDVLAYPLSPQVHATDDLSLIENLQSLGDTVRTARSSAAGIPLAIGPVRFHRRPDPFAKGNGGVNREPELPDPRQQSKLGAVWTLALVRELAEAGADSVTLFEITGPFGVMDDRGPFPVCSLLAEIGAFKESQIHHLELADPLRETGLAMCQGDRFVCLIGNLTDVERPFRIEGLEGYSGSPWKVESLDRDPARSSRLNPRSGRLELLMGPWEILRLENERSPS